MMEIKTEKEKALDDFLYEVLSLITDNSLDDSEWLKERLQEVYDRGYRDATDFISGGE